MSWPFALSNVEEWIIYQTLTHRVIENLAHPSTGSGRAGLFKSQLLYLGLKQHAGKYGYPRCLIVWRITKP
jgi:hypothetical protein